MSKNVLGRDYVVPPLEALWWADDMRAFTSAREKAQWKWTLLLFVPDWLTTEHVQAATEAVRRKKNVPAQGLTLHGFTPRDLPDGSTPDRT